MDHDLHRRFPWMALDLMVRVANTSSDYWPDSLQKFLVQFREADRITKKLVALIHLNSSLE